MTTGLLSKGAAVRNIFIVFFLLIALTSQGQSGKKITVQFHHVPLSEALQQIGQQANVHFIYSSNIVDPGQRITFSAHGTTLKETIGQLGSELGLDFKVQDDYVIVRKSTAVVASHQSPVAGLGEAANTASNETLFAPRTFLDYGSPISFEEEALRHRRLYRLDSIQLQNRLAQVINKKSAGKQKPGMYASFGLFANDYAAGPELQFGIRHLYGVLNAGFMRDGLIRIGAGVGTSIPLIKRVSLNPVYTISSIKVLTDDGLESIRNGGYNIAATHHQVKWMVQYGVFKNLTLRAGPSLNLMKLTYTAEAARMAHPQNFSGVQAYQGPYGNSFLFITAPPSGVHSVNPRLETLKTWVGFEAGISYSINFLPNR